MLRLELEVKRKHPTLRASLGAGLTLTRSRALGRQALGEGELSATQISVVFWCQDMRRAGFCPHWTEFFAKEYGILFLNYMACLPIQHTKSLHKDCDASRCVANNVDMAHYETRHVSEACTCRFEGPDIEDVVKLISDSSIPIIKCKEKANGNLDISAVGISAGTPYTSIPHVWSGGLGNPSTNTLPQCQLKRLKRVVETRPHKRQPVY